MVMDAHAHRFLADENDEKGLSMAGHVLPSTQRGSFQGVIDISQYCDFANTPAREALPSKSGIEMEIRASAEGIGCVRGTALALLFEAAAGVFIYGIWQLCHIVR